MKAYSTALQAALDAGDGVICVGALKVATAVNPARVWTGAGDLELGGETYTGIDQGLVQVTGGQLGSASQSIELVLPGLDPALIPILDEIDAKRAPVVIWRVFFASDCTTLLDAHVFARGRIDGLPIDETPGGEAKLTARVETAAHGQGRQTGRMRADADMRMVSLTDGSFRWLTAAPSKTLAWGGKPPARAGAALPNAQTVARQFVEGFQL